MADKNKIQTFTGPDGIDYDFPVSMSLEDVRSVFQRKFPHISVEESTKGGPLTLNQVRPGAGTAIGNKGAVSGTPNTLFQKRTMASGTEPTTTADVVVKNITGSIEGIPEAITSALTNLPEKFKNAPQNFIKGIKNVKSLETAIPGSIPSVIHGAITKDPQELERNISGAIMGLGVPEAGEEASAMSEVPRKTMTSADAENSLIAGFTSHKAGNVPFVGQDAPAATKYLRKAGGRLGYTSDTFKDAGVSGLDKANYAIGHARNLIESEANHITGPIQNELVDISKFPELQGEFPNAAQVHLPQNPSSGTVPAVSVKDLIAKKSDLNKRIQMLRTRNPYIQAPTTEAATTAGPDPMATLKQSRDQSAAALYDHVQNRTGINLQPMKQAERTLFHLDDTMNDPQSGLVNGLREQEAKYQTAPLPEKVGRYVGSIRGYFGGQPRIGISEPFAGYSKTVSPLDAFNKHMSNLFKDIKPEELDSNPSQTFFNNKTGQPERYSGKPFSNPNVAGEPPSSTDYTKMADTNEPDMSFVNLANRGGVSNLKSPFDVEPKPPIKGALPSGQYDMPESTLNQKWQKWPARNRYDNPPVAPSQPLLEHMQPVEGEYVDTPSVPPVIKGALKRGQYAAKQSSLTQPTLPEGASPSGFFGFLGSGSNP